MCKLQGSAYTYTEKLVDEYFQIFSTNRRNSRLKVFSQSKSLKIICEELKFVVKLQDDSLIASLIEKCLHAYFSSNLLSFS